MSEGAHGCGWCGASVTFSREAGRSVNADGTDHTHAFDRAEVRREVGVEYHIIPFQQGRLWVELQRGPTRATYGWCCDACHWSGTKTARFGEAQSAALAHRCGFPPPVTDDSLF